MSCPRKVPAVFTASATSAAIDTKEGTIVGFEIPSGFTGVSLSFKATSDADNGTYNDVYYLSGVAATILTITSVAASRQITIDPKLLAGFRYLKLVSNASETLTVNVMIRDTDGGR